MKKKAFIFILTIMSFFLNPVCILARKSFAGLHEKDIPVDGGSFTMLIVAGVAYGLREAHKRKNNEEADL